MGAVVLVVSNLSGSTSVAGLLARLVAAGLCGLVAFGAVVIWLGRRHDRRHDPRRKVEPGRLTPLRDRV
jgi:hypothetical protein